MTSDKYAEFRLWMKALRDELQLSQEDFGAKAGIPKATIQSWESEQGGRNIGPLNYEKLQRACEKYGWEGLPEMDPQEMRKRQITAVARARGVRKHPKEDFREDNAVQGIRALLRQRAPYLDVYWEGTTVLAGDAPAVLIYRCHYLSHRLVMSIVDLPFDLPAAAQAVRTQYRDRLWDLSVIRQERGLPRAVLALVGKENDKQLHQIVQLLAKTAKARGVTVMLFGTGVEVVELVRGIEEK